MFGNLHKQLVDDCVAVRLHSVEGRQRIHVMLDDVDGGTVSLGFAGSVELAGVDVDGLAVDHGPAESVVPFMVGNMCWVVCFCNEH